MVLNNIDSKIDVLVNKYKTRDPFVIARHLGVKIFFEDLGSIYGYYNQDSRIKIIHLNSKLNSNELDFTCAHELGHSIFHPDSNTPFLSSASLTSELKIEKEANYFASKLRIDNSHKDFELNGKYQILDYYGLPYEMEKFLWNSNTLKGCENLEIRLLGSILLLIVGIMNPFVNFGEYSILTLLMTTIFSFLISYVLLPKNLQILVNKVIINLLSKKSSAVKNQDKIRTRNKSLKSDDEYLSFLLSKELEKIDKMDGLSFEGYCAKLLTSIGYTNVNVTKSSGDQGIDVLAKSGNTAYGFQCKNYSKPVGNSSVQEAHAGRSFYNLDKTIVFTNNYFTTSAKNIAKETNVDLWDRDTLTELIVDSLK